MEGILNNIFQVKLPTVITSLDSTLYHSGRVIALLLWWLICAMSYYRVFGAKRRKGATRKPAKWSLFVFSHGDLSPRHTKVRHFSCFAFSPPVCGIFAWRGERSPRENTKKSQCGGFSRGDLSHRQAKIRHIYKWRVFAFHLSCFRLAGRKVTTRKHATS